MVAVSRSGFQHCESGCQCQLRCCGRELCRNIGPPTVQQAAACAVEAPGFRRRAEAEHGLAAIKPQRLLVAIQKRVETARIARIGSTINTDCFVLEWDDLNRFAAVSGSLMGPLLSH